MLAQIASLNPGVFGSAMQNLKKSAVGSDPTTTVADLAQRHGFTQLGRFAAVYRREFGEMPSATLARMRGSGGKVLSEYLRHLAVSPVESHDVAG
jgi:AraC-like DNA-binding protein